MAAKSARETSALLEQLQQKQRSKGASATQQPASSGTSQLAGSVANKEETWQEVSARKTAARHAETAQRVQARLDSYTAQQVGTWMCICVSLLVSMATSVTGRIGLYHACDQLGGMLGGIQVGLPIPTICFFSGHLCLLEHTVLKLCQFLTRQNRR